MTTANQNSDEAQESPRSEEIEELVAAYQKRTLGSKEYAERHQEHHADKSSIAIGATSSMKALSYPIVVERASGSRIWDVDGNEFVDILQGLGANLFGHNPDFVREALERQLAKGFPIGAQTKLAGKVAEQVTQLTGMPRVCFSNTGTEAIMAAIRVARAKTGRSKIAVFADSYHGHADTVLMRASLAEYARRKILNRVADRAWFAPMSALLRRFQVKRSAPASVGIPKSLASEVVVLNYGDPNSLHAIKSMSGKLAAVLVEPVQSRRPELQPREFLQSLREVTQAAGIALIFDEMVTGFRSHPGGAQALFEVRADLATYSKVVGGGLPLSVIAGKHEFMDFLQPRPQSANKSVFFAGTFCKHPLSLAAAHAALSHMLEAGPLLQEELTRKTAIMVERLNQGTKAASIPVQFTHFGSFFSIAMRQSRINPQNVNLLSYYLLHHGIHLRGGDRGGFLTTAHSDQDIDQVVETFSDGLKWVFGSDAKAGV